MNTELCTFIRFGAIYVYLLFVVHSNIEIILRRLQRTKIHPVSIRTSVCHTGNRLTELKWKLRQTNQSCCYAKITITRSVWHAFGVNISIPFISHFGYSLEVPNSSRQISWPPRCMKHFIGYQKRIVQCDAMMLLSATNNAYRIFETLSKCPSVGKNKRRNG